MNRKTSHRHLHAPSIEAIRKSGGRLNDFAVAEMHDYLRRIGYQASDLNKLNVVHITGTKGKGSTSAFTERILRTHLPGRIGKLVQMSERREDLDRREGG